MSSSGPACVSHCRVIARIRDASGVVGAVAVLADDIKRKDRIASMESASE